MTSSFHSLSEDLKKQLEDSALLDCDVLILRDKDISEEFTQRVSARGRGFVGIQWGGATNIGSMSDGPKAKSRYFVTFFRNPATRTGCKSPDEIATAIISTLNDYRRSDWPHVQDRVAWIASDPYQTVFPNTDLSGVLGDTHTFESTNQI